MRCSQGAAHRMRHFTYRNLGELQREADRLGASHVRFEESPADIRRLVTKPVDIGAVRVGNSMAIHPMEGCDSTSDGRPDGADMAAVRAFRGWRREVAVVLRQPPCARMDAPIHRQLWTQPRQRA